MHEYESTSIQHEEPEGKFMVAVGAVIEHTPSRRILLVKRADMASYEPGIWEDPMGRMKQFEEPEQALRREVMEETGLEIEVVKPIAVVHDYRGEKTAENEWVGIIYWCKAQSDQVVLSHEHTAYLWISPDEALGLVEHIGVLTDIRAFIVESAVN